MAAYKNVDLFSAINELHIVDEKILKSCLSVSDNCNLPLGEIILSKDLLSEDNLGKIIGDLISVPYVNLTEVNILSEVLHLIPKKVAQVQQIIAFKNDEKGLHVATSDPSNTQIIEFLSKKTGKSIIKYFSSQSQINKALNLYSQSITKAFDEIIAKNVQEAKGDKNAEPPIIKIVDTILKYAYENNASDVHVEPLEESTLVRFRLDGILHDIVKLPHELDSQIVTRVKVMANLRTDEHQEAQDGKINFQIQNGNQNEHLDIRISVAPTTKGEKIVMRLLSERTRHFSLSDLGFVDEDLKKVEDAYHLPHGMILATGPTGSGKTTTLYAILKLINTRKVNIMTIEDPVEYQVENVNQIQVNIKTDLTFARGLRSIVRQDPDVILVGEIRDEETADISVNSAMTGHLVLSSLHTNDAVTTFPRLIDMGVEPYLIATTVNVVIAQRLVRKICNKCRVTIDVPYDKLDKQIQKYFGKSSKQLLYHGKGCDICHKTGYVGRIGIYEILLMNEELSQAIVDKKNSYDLRKISIKSGMRTMLEDGIEKVKQGITTIEEILRVTKE
ncbi:hypothetical protein A3A93_00970 [Candidatus Roizmanbacteria bacterium RIFCSPLOWO2_01_FULL_38_12]|uniref:Bacterial type II secretion system protein E domain-containing protein n=1 Tax=Candidatus Roizmanbacteria bacterium RIFCSPLOWO2_01_FULL_38_12 TaxID=1802061 RepID=A0A1F7IR75_9BACT|nr:MAG: hypothetical protein A2861_01775 [Candidatus Roizmanbacteria bacterium RIFCSPHIGHO2_01_FULL_38_15]OGK34747.1 MAG: hypothetical protein A3F59_04430 [Candidatus Roizmanbacteria bacterium RIFCSPHIGHO2_12_FULL_38_13]OGK45865.1 MAG: hypothetical protein A3A93_00970 [Candidatus Roizmanbacteria bacterium RIFCSPLOWO2_01_FULL_38_12]